MNQPNKHYVSLLEEKMEDLKDDYRLKFTMRKNRPTSGPMEIGWYQMNLQQFWLPDEEPLNRD